MKGAGVRGLAMLASACTVLVCPAPAAADTRASVEKLPGFARPSVRIVGDELDNHIVVTNVVRYRGGPFEVVTRIAVRGPVTAGRGCDIVRRGHLICRQTRPSSTNSAVISGGGGDDEVIIAGNDLRRAVLGGGSGRDLLSAESINDADLRGGPGADTIAVPSGQGKSLGGGGDDLITGTGASDVIYGGPGADVLVGKGGSDVIHSEDGTGDDVVDCGEDQADDDHDLAFVDGPDRRGRQCEEYFVVRDNR